MRQIIISEYQHVMDTVLRHYGMDEQPMLHSNKAECVDARATLVAVLVQKGLTESEVVQLTGLTQQCINKLKNSIRQREKGWSFRETLRIISSEL